MASGKYLPAGKHRKGRRGKASKHGRVEYGGETARPEDGAGQRAGLAGGASKTTRPPAIVVATLTSLMARGSRWKMSASRITRSASLPGAIVPFSFSWNSA